MNIYAESNFVLELALMQEEQDSCEGILQLCESGDSQLVLPAFSLAEPYDTLTRRDKDRKQLAQRVEAELRQLGRSKPYKTETDLHRTMAALLVRSGEEETQRLFQVRDRLLKIAEIIPLDKAILISAAQIQSTQKLSAPDAIVLASTMQHLTLTNSTQSCFLNKNSYDFDDPDIEDMLAARNCKMILSFPQGLNYIHNHPPYFLLP